MIEISYKRYTKRYQFYTVREAVKKFREEFGLVGKHLKGELSVRREVGKDGVGFSVWRECKGV